MLIKCLDWNFYFGEPTPTIETQQESPELGEDDAVTMNFSDTTT
jgi:hypothetical protein